jgi:hypothetical protein
MTNIMECNDVVVSILFCTGELQASESGPETYYFGLLHSLKFPTHFALVIACVCISYIEC